MHGFLRPRIKNSAPRASNPRDLLDRCFSSYMFSSIFLPTRTRLLHVDLPSVTRRFFSFTFPFSSFTMKITWNVALCRTRIHLASAASTLKTGRELSCGTQRGFGISAAIVTAPLQRGESLIVSSAMPQSSSTSHVDGGSLRKQRIFAYSSLTSNRKWLEFSSAGIVARTEFRISRRR